MFYAFSRWVVRTVMQLIYFARPVHVEREPMEGPVIVCANHRSNLDPPLVACFMKRQVSFMAKAELFRIPLFSSLIRKYGAFPVTRGGVTMETIRTAIDVVKSGKVIVIFPEGTRQRTGKLGEGKKGAASIALRSGAKIWPVAIIGEYRWFRPMKVVYGEPFDAQSVVSDVPKSQQTEVLTAKIMASIQELLDQYS